MVARLERLLALCPDNNKCRFQQATILSSRQADDCVRGLSPISAARVSALQDPSRTTAAEHEKTMTGAEQSVRKALALLVKTTSDLQAEEEKDRAMQERMEQLRMRKLAELSKQKEKARASGRAAADAEAGVEDAKP